MGHHLPRGKAAIARRTPLPEAAPRCGFRPSCSPCRLWQGLCLMGRLWLGMGQVWRHAGGRMVRSPGDVVQDCAPRRFAPRGVAAICTLVQQIRKLCSPAQAGYRDTPSRRTPLSAGRLGATSHRWRGVSPRWSWRLGVGTDDTVVACRQRRSLRAWALRGPVCPEKLKLSIDLTLFELLLVLVQWTPPSSGMLGKEVSDHASRHLGAGGLHYPRRLLTDDFHHYHR
jgi:hypothetical protein